MARFLIVDDHPSFRRMARRLLTARGDEVVGEAADGAMALTSVARLRPDAVLLDIGLPDVDGIRLAATLAAAHPATAVVLTSSRPAAEHGPALVGAHALGFVAKDELAGPALDALLEAQ